MTALEAFTGPVKCDGDAPARLDTDQARLRTVTRLSWIHGFIKALGFRETAPEKRLGFLEQLSERLGAKV